MRATARANANIALVKYWGKRNEAFRLPMNGSISLTLDGLGATTTVEFDEKPDHPGNVWWHQSRLANEMYAALDGQQREKALLTKTPDDNFDQMKVRGSKAEIPGLSGEELSADQKDLLKSTVRSMLSMFRESSVDEAVDCIQQNGGIDKLRVSFYKDLDLGSDGMWDNWRVEGPAFVWYFRGSPHVHVWVNVADSPNVQLNA